MHRCRFGDAERAKDQMRDPRAPIEVLAGDLLHMRFANRGRRGIEMAFVGAPALGKEAGDAQRRSERLQWEKHVILAVAQSPTPTRSHGDEQWHAITTAAPLASRHHSISHRVLS